MPEAKRQKRKKRDFGSLFENARLPIQSPPRTPTQQRKRRKKPHKIEIDRNCNPSAVQIADLRLSIGITLDSAPLASPSSSALHSLLPSSLWSETPLRSLSMSFLSIFATYYPSVRYCNMRKSRGRRRTVPYLVACRYYFSSPKLVLYAPLILFLHFRTQGDHIDPFLAQERGTPQPRESLFARATVELAGALRRPSSIGTLAPSTPCECWHCYSFWL